MTTQKVVTEREYEETLEIKNNLRKQLITSGIFDLETVEKIIQTFDEVSTKYRFIKEI